MLVLPTGNPWSSGLAGDCLRHARVDVANISLTAAPFKTVRALNKKGRIRRVDAVGVVKAEACRANSVRIKEVRCARGDGVDKTSAYPSMLERFCEQEHDDAEENNAEAFENSAL